MTDGMYEKLRQTRLVDKMVREPARLVLTQFRFEEAAEEQVVLDCENKGGSHQQDLKVV